MPQILDHVPDFCAYLDAECGCARTTLISYRSDLRMLSVFLAEAGLPLDVARIRVSHIRQFLAHERKRGIATATVTRRVNSMRSFFRYLEEVGEVRERPTRLLRQPRRAHRVPVALSDEEARRLLQAAYQNHYTLVGFRDHAALATLIFAGLRRSELLALTVLNVDLTEGWLQARQGKGRRDRRVPICDALVRGLADWLEFRPETYHGFLFTDRLGRPLGKNGLYAALRRALGVAGIDRPGITLNVLRHSFASSLIRSGANVAELQRLLGHASLETTGIYISIADESLRRAVGGHPLNTVT